MNNKIVKKIANQLQSFLNSEGPLSSHLMDEESFNRKTRRGILLGRRKSQKIRSRNSEFNGRLENSFRHPPTNRGK